MHESWFVCLPLDIPMRLFDIKGRLELGLGDAKPLLLALRQRRKVAGNLGSPAPSLLPFGCASFEIASFFLCAGRSDGQSGRFVHGWLVLFSPTLKKFSSSFDNVAIHDQFKQGSANNHDKPQKFSPLRAKRGVRRAIHQRAPRWSWRAPDSKESAGHPGVSPRVFVSW